MEKTEKLWARLGKDTKAGRVPVLLPIDAKQKGPRVQGWQTKTAADMERPDWLAQIEAHENTGVLLGPPSGGLCTIDVDNDEFVEVILALNPRLRGALRTRGAKGCQIWLWMLPDTKREAFGLPSYPAARYNINHRARVVERSLVGGSTTMPFVVCEWRGGDCQSVVQGIHPDGHAYTVLVDAPPMEYRFRDIKWPECVVLPWEQTDAVALQNQFGPPFVETKDGRVMTDHFWAGRFALYHDVLFEPDENSFYLYQGPSGAWEKRTQAEVSSMVSLDLLATSGNEGFETLQGNVCRAYKRIGSVVKFLEGGTTKRKAFDRSPGMIHFANGFLDANAEVPELLPFSPDYMSRNPLLWNYDPEAKCPNFEEVLLGQALDGDDILTLQKCFGALLLGHNLLQRIVILTGTAGGGKSQLLNVFTRIIGLHNVATLRTEQLSERFEMDAFVGKTLITGPDVSGDFLRQKAIGKLKALTGGDLLAAEKKGGGMSQLLGNLNVVITCNSRLTLKMEDDADAWRRRLIIINFEKPAPDRPIPDLGGKLLLGDVGLGWSPEASGIINWGLLGARVVLKEAREDGKVLLSRRQHNRINDLLAESESVRHFIKNMVEKTEKERKEDVTTEDLLDGYRNFCMDRSWSCVPDSQFMNQCCEWILKIHSCARSNDIKRKDASGALKAKRGYRNLRLIDPPEGDCA